MRCESSATARLNRVVQLCGSLSEAIVWHTGWNRTAAGDEKVVSLYGYLDVTNNVRQPHYHDTQRMTMTNKNDFLSCDELQNAIENDGTGNNYKTAADFLLSAVTDYPIFNLKEPSELVIALRQKVNNKLTFDNLNNYLKSLSPDKDAWTMEAKNSLLEMFDFDRKNTFDCTIELETIIRQLTQHYRQ